jgi:chemotaxis protein methyltransferase CheR
MLADNFHPESGKFRVRSSIRRRVEFRMLNLLDAFVELGPFDVIFCRNVLMYFDAATKANILDRLSDTLADDGYLVLGAAETMLGLSNSFASDGQPRGVKMKASQAQMSRAMAIG